MVLKTEVFPLQRPLKICCAIFYHQFIEYWMWNENEYNDEVLEFCLNFGPFCNLNIIKV